MQIQDILDHKGNAVKTVSRSATVGFVVELISALKIASVVVVDDSRRPLGILTERHIVKALALDGRQALDFFVTQVMGTSVPVCAPSDTVQSAMRTMTRRRVRHIVVQDRGRMVGIISIGDVVKNHIRDTELENRVLKDLAKASVLSAT